MDFAGLVVVWSGSSPRLDTYRIPKSGEFVFGRAHVGDADDRVSAKHARFVISGNVVAVEDLGSRNKTHLAGREVTSRTDATLPSSVVRMGRTIGVLVNDVRPYENVKIHKHGNVVVAGSLAESVRTFEQAALDEENVTVIGTWSIARALALGYAQRVGGNHVMVDSSTMRVSVERAIEIAKPPRTIILILGHPFSTDDVAAMSTWLETDVRVITCARFEGQVLGMPEAIASRLTARVVTIPRQRFDELPTTIIEMVQTRKPDLKIHATALEAVLVNGRSLDEDILLERVRDAIDAQKGDELRNEDVVPYLETPFAVHKRIVGNAPRRRPR